MRKGLSFSGFTFVGWGEGREGGMEGGREGRVPTGEMTGLQVEECAKEGLGGGL
jgi:hypothetical protein